MHFIVATPGNFVPYQIDDAEFPQGTARSCKGSLHVRPKATLTVTAGELAVLKARTPGVTVRAKVKPEDPPKSSKPAMQVVENVPLKPAPKPNRGDAEKRDDDVG